MATKRGGDDDHTRNVVGLQMATQHLGTLVAKSAAGENAEVAEELKQLQPNQVIALLGIAIHILASDMMNNLPGVIVVEGNIAEWLGGGDAKD